MKHTEETKDKIRNSEYHKNLKGINNPFYGKTHTKETIKKIVNSEGYKNKKSIIGRKHNSETIKKMSKKRIKPGKEWNYNYRHDVKYEGKDRSKIIEWCRMNNGITDEIAKIWFKSCSVCGWDKMKCDLHHKIPKRLGGKTTIENLTVLCPNCHRLEHRKWNETNKDKRKKLYANKRYNANSVKERTEIVKKKG